MNAKHILDNLSTHVKNVIANAISTATSLQHKQVTPTHMLSALLEEQGSVGAEILHKCSIDKKTVATVLNKHKDEPSLLQEKNTLLPELSNTSRKILEKAMLSSYECGHNYVGTEHLLHGLIEITDKQITSIFQKNKITRKHVEEQINIILQSTSKFPNIEEITEIVEDIHETQEEHPPQQTPKRTLGHQKKHKKKQPARAIDIFTVCLTDKKVQKDIDPVIGREEEIERLIQVLCRRTKNNPVLVGEAGVGKTAIVEGLAKRIQEGTVPDALKRKKLYSLDLTLLISGTIYRGEFESRVKQLIDELSAMPDCMLFIDELHNIIGAGSNQGTMDAANILKPALARGKLRCIGATTIDEYKKYISSDPALERRIQSIPVEEPSQNDAITILQGIKKYYESYHNVRITDAAITSAVTLSAKYIHDAYLPDKAIDLIDEASAGIRILRPTSAIQKKIHATADAIAHCEKEKEIAIETEQFEKAMKLKKKKIALEKKLHTLQKQKDPVKKTKVTEKHVAKILSKKLGIAESVLLSSEWQKIHSVNTGLKKHIHGQDHVVDCITTALQVAQLRPHAHKPLASFIFAGPSGVGKTALAKVLAKELYHDEKALIKFDMSEFAEGHSVSKLLGSPAGYVGHNDRNLFAEHMKKRPYSVIIFDEIDKAHKDVTRLLLQILDEGELTGSNGKKIRFSHAIIILTTNLGAEFFASQGIGFGTGEKAEKDAERNKKIQAHMKEVLHSALLGRITNTCIFNEISQDAAEKIVSKHIQDINTILTQKVGFTITAPKTTIAQIAKKRYNKDTGARAIEQAITTLINDLVILQLSQTEKKTKNTYTLKAKNGDYHLI